MPTSILPESFWLGSSTWPPATTSSNLRPGSAGVKPLGLGPATCAIWIGPVWAEATPVIAVPAAAAVPESRKSLRDRSIEALAWRPSALGDGHVRPQGVTGVDLRRAEDPVARFPLLAHVRHPPERARSREDGGEEIRRDADGCKDATGEEIDVREQAASAEARGGDVLDGQGDLIEIRDLGARGNHLSSEPLDHLRARVLHVVDAVAEARDLHVVVEHVLDLRLGLC